MIDDLENQEKPNLNKKEKKQKKHPTLRFWGKIFIILTVTFLVIAFSLSLKVISVIGSQGEKGDIEKISIFQQISRLISKRGEKIKGEEEDRINILLLGIGGYGHQGSLLTDTIILVSIKPSTKQVALISIPRDLAVEYPKNYYWRKINNAIAFGREMDYPGGGEALAIDLAQQVTGQKIHYYGRIDFSGFKEIIDGLGGIKVNIEKSFSDYSYPTNNYGYKTVSFSAGEQVLNGETALEYVRSRHGTNGEGSDFARARRQQKVIIALKDKITAFSTLINAQKISAILNSLGSHTKTNMEIWEMLRIYRLIQGVNENNIITKVIDNGPDGLLKHTTGLNGAYILTPRAGDFSEIHQFCKDIFEQNNSNSEKKAKISLSKDLNKKH